MLCYSISTNNENTITTQESVETFEEETPNKVKKVELEIQSDKEDSSGTNSDVGMFYSFYIIYYMVCLIYGLSICMSIFKYFGKLFNFVTK